MDAHSFCQTFLHPIPNDESGPYSRLSCSFQHPRNTNYSFQGSASFTDTYLHPSPYPPPTNFSNLFKHSLSLSTQPTKFVSLGPAHDRLSPGFQAPFQNHNPNQENLSQDVRCLPTYQYPTDTTGLYSRSYFTAKYPWTSSPPTPPAPPAQFFQPYPPPPYAQPSFNGVHNKDRNRSEQTSLGGVNERAEIHSTTKYDQPSSMIPKAHILMQKESNSEPLELPTIEKSPNTVTEHPTSFPTKEDPQIQNGDQSDDGHPTQYRNYESKESKALSEYANTEKSVPMVDTAAISPGPIASYSKSPTLELPTVVDPIVGKDSTGITRSSNCSIHESSEVDSVKSPSCDAVFNDASAEEAANEILPSESQPLGSDDVETTFVLLVDNETDSGKNPAQTSIRQEERKFETTQFSELSLWEEDESCDIFGREDAFLKEIESARRCLSALAPPQTDVGVQDSHVPLVSLPRNELLSLTSNLFNQALLPSCQIDGQALMPILGLLLGSSDPLTGRIQVKKVEIVDGGEFLPDARYATFEENISSKMSLMSDKESEHCGGELSEQNPSRGCHSFEETTPGYELRRFQRIMQHASSNSYEGDGMDVVGWFQADLGCGVYLDEYASSAFQTLLQESQNLQSGKCIPKDAMYAQVDVLRSSGSDLCIECFDLRTSEPLNFLYSVE